MDLSLSPAGPGHGQGWEMWGRRHEEPLFREISSRKLQKMGTIKDLGEDRFGPSCQKTLSEQTQAWWRCSGQKWHSGWTRVHDSDKRVTSSRESRSSIVLDCPSKYTPCLVPKIKIPFFFRHLDGDLNLDEIKNVL